jgi:hypothetical protein
LILLASPLERAPPEGDDVVSEGCECPAVGRHGVIVEEACHDLPQPFPLFGDRPVHASSHFLFQLQELRPHTVSPCFPVDQEAALSGLTTDEGETQEVEGLRFAQSALLSVGSRMAAEFDQAGFLRLERQRKLLLAAVRTRAFPARNRVSRGCGDLYAASG